jgi:3-hydroxyisobutyrate dehydrogenase-like beta-hydroxyacid dehydrogenase
MSGSTIGVIGLGAMGFPMSERLARAGFDVVGYDVNQDVMSAAPHIRAARSVGELVSTADRIVISVVRTLSQTEAVVAEVDRHALILIIMSTITPSAMGHLEQELTRRGVTLVDAPVSGGVAGAQAGTLTIMVAGPEDALETVRPVLDAIGSNIFQIGERPGAAQTVKLASQVMLAANMLGVWEGMRLAADHGLSAEQLLPVVAASRGASWVSSNWDDVLKLWRDYRPGEALDLVHKDLNSALTEALEHRVPMPVTALAAQLLHHAGEMGGMTSRSAGTPGDGQASRTDHTEE